MYAWGTNYCGESGNSNMNSCGMIDPVEVELPLQAKPIVIAGGDYFSAALVEYEEGEQQSSSSESEEECSDYANDRKYHYRNHVHNHNHNLNHYHNDDDDENKEEGEDEDDFSTYHSSYTRSTHTSMNKTTSIPHSSPQNHTSHTSSSSSSSSSSSLSSSLFTNTPTPTSPLYGSTSFAQRGYRTLDSTASLDRPRAVQSSLVNEILVNNTQHPHLPSPLRLMPSRSSMPNTPRHGHRPPPFPLSRATTATAATTTTTPFTTMATTPSFSASAPLTSTSSSRSVRQEIQSSSHRFPGEGRMEQEEQENDICFASRAARAAALEKQFKMFRH